MSLPDRKGFKPESSIEDGGVDDCQVNRPKKSYGDDEMKRLLLVLVLIAVAISGCTEKAPSGTKESVGNIKTLTIKSADNLSTYSLKSSVTQTMKLNAAGINATPEKETAISESAETVASVNLSGFQAKASGLTKSVLELPGQPANSSSTQADVYQIGNSTYVKDEKGQWTHLKDPRSAAEIWGEGNNNQVRSLALMINQSQTESIGSETIDGVDTIKLKILIGKGDYDNLYNTALGTAARLVQYPLFTPSVNSKELNETASMEKLIWISKDTYLPKKYQSSLSFKMTPEVIGSLDPSTGQMIKLNQSVRLGQVSVSVQTYDLYY
ncbi:Uncharacterised protein [uncultured archaeon]|nr:Uncharacterised protein [uncultured archaeon]